MAPAAASPSPACVGPPAECIVAGVWRGRPGCRSSFCVAVVQLGQRVFPSGEQTCCEHGRPILYYGYRIKTIVTVMGFFCRWMAKLPWRRREWNIAKCGIVVHYNINQYNKFPREYLPLLFCPRSQTFLLNTYMKGICFIYDRVTSCLTCKIDSWECNGSRRFHSDRSHRRARDTALFDGSAQVPGSPDFPSRSGCEGVPAAPCNRSAVHPRATDSVNTFGSFFSACVSPLQQCSPISCGHELNIGI